MTSAAQGAPPAVSAERAVPGPAGLPVDTLPADTLPAIARRLASRIVTLCWVELRKIRHDRTELYTRAIQPALWLLIFGETFTKIHAIPTPGHIPYLAYLAPGILAQSALFIAIFYGIQIIWERDAGVLTKLMVTPTPRAALITGKAFAAGVRSIVQAAVIVELAAILGVALTDNPLKLLASAAIVVLGSAFFSCLSMSIAGLALSRDRLMGIGQAITMPLFFSSNALYQSASCPAGCRRSARSTRCRTRWTRSAGCSSGPRRTSDSTPWCSSAPPSSASPPPPSCSPAWRGSSSQKRRVPGQITSAWTAEPVPHSGRARPPSAAASPRAVRRMVSAASTAARAVIA